MGTARQVVSLTRPMLVMIGIGAFASSSVAEAQVGLTSGMAQVALVARIPPRGSIEQVSSHRQTAATGTMREFSVTVRLSANTGYRLIVRGMGVPTSPIWVRSADGTYQELRSGTSVTVARDSHCAGQWQREVRYRTEVTDSGDENPRALPVRYEIAIDPTL